MPTPLRASRSCGSALAVTAASSRGPSSRFTGPIAAEARSGPAATACRGLALESATAWTAWHALADEGDAVRDIAEVIGRRRGLPVQAVPEVTHGPLGPPFVMEQPAASAHTRQVLGWTATHSSLLEDLEAVQL